MEVSSEAIRIAQVAHIVEMCFSDKDLSPEELAPIITRECARYSLSLRARDYLVSYLVRKMC